VVVDDVMLILLQICQATALKIMHVSDWVLHEEHHPF
jgi:hypothetical protein